MPEYLPGSCLRVLEFQHGVIARWQAAAAGLDAPAMDARLRRRRWQPIYRGVYAAFTGDPGRESMLWAAVLRAGPGAALSHHTAAEVNGLTEHSADLIHVTVAADRQVAVSRRERHPLAPGLVVHRSARIDIARHPVRAPSRTRVEETALDLAQIARNLDEAVAWLSGACGRRLTTAAMLRKAMDARGKMRWRAELSIAVAEIGDGVHSALEYRYVRNVERAHRLPAAKRQAKKTCEPKTRYLDNDYQDFGVAVELDGRVAHPAEARWADIRRDNCSAVSGIITLRYNWSDVTTRPCEVAAEVAAVLRQRGWPGQPAACRPRCAAAFMIPGISRSP
jgi:very-short-patch-repair endonuclease